MSYLHHQYWPLQPVVPARTASSSPTTTVFPVVAGHLYSVRFQIPAGHNGLTGIKLTYQGQQIIPWGSSLWLIGSGDVFDIDWDQDIMGSGLAVVTYNTDLVAHQFFVYADLVPTLEGTADSPDASTIGDVPDAATLADIGALSSTPTEAPVVSTVGRPRGFHSRPVAHPKRSERQQPGRGRRRS